MKESDLYLPLKTFLESKNYEVKGEVCGCDVMAMCENEEPIIVELKLALNLDVILQAVNRLALSSSVYIGIPKECKSFKKKRKECIKLLKMLSLGLIVIDTKTSNIDVLIEPCEYKPRQVKKKKNRLLNEFEKRVGDPNLGGMTTKKGVITAYRQKAITIAIYLNKHGQTKASVMAKELNEPKVRDIVYKNFYGWFERIGAGVYHLSLKGKEELKHYEFFSRNEER